MAEGLVYTGVSINHHIFNILLFYNFHYLYYFLINDWQVWIGELLEEGKEKIDLLWSLVLVSDSPYPSAYLIKIIIIN